ncbi:hypothetical protein VZC37_08860 [Gordonia sp. LSe1-13]|uniref:Uncharacterized protein n=2 Tax=Gordonia TaxID=2053 RepID=A0ABU7MBG6_9ACTN|nr:hypothetical protein [Gordonia sp. LSe1-13]MEE4022960.1 hypothetical protein [Gordonia sp. PKS22-38]
MTVLATVVNGCAVSPFAGDDEETCSSEFDPRAAGEPLGSSNRFLHVSAAAGATPGLTTTLAELTAQAGWAQSYDQMIKQFDGMSDPEINELAGTGTICWQVPHGAPDVGATGSYIFLKARKPVQAVRWDAAGDRDPISLLDTPGGINPDTALTSRPGVNPRLVVAAPIEG